jgi:hypothetical protein
MSEEPNTGFNSEQPNIEEERRSKEIIQNGVNRSSKPLQSFHHCDETLRPQTEENSFQAFFAFEDVVLCRWRQSYIFENVRPDDVRRDMSVHRILSKMKLLHTEE